MNEEDAKLLRSYSREGSEAAFAELVTKYVDLVYSAALRQVGGDGRSAEDITQAVFTDLARKASQLTRHPSLAGWLYTSTRFLAGSFRRGESRRLIREQTAYAMNSQEQPLAHSEPDWAALSPILDDAMHELSEPDREAILMRFFEGRRLADIGPRLGVSENGARMRLERALDKLRLILSRRGITSTAAALGASLARQSVRSAPGELAGRISSHAVAAAASGVSAAPLTLLFMTTTKIKTVIGAAGAIAAVIALLFWMRTDVETGNRPDEWPAPAVERLASTGAGQEPPGMEAGLTGLESVAEPEGLRHLALTVVAAATGRHLPDTQVWVVAGLQLDKLGTGSDGVCDIWWPSSVGLLQIFIHHEGFVGTRLQWAPERGERIPDHYLLWLEGEATPIGGRVIDSTGQPVAGAEVRFDPATRPIEDAKRVSTQTAAQTVTDETGVWRINHFAEEVIPHLTGHAQHPAHAGSPRVFVERNRTAEKLLREGDFTFQLGRAVTVHGLVVDADHQPVADANVFVGHVGDSDGREGITGADGRFQIAGCGPGKNWISAAAPGFAHATVEADFSETTGPYTLRLKPGSALRLRVINPAGQPVRGAHVSLWSGKAPVPAYVFQTRTDAEGRVTWREAPDVEMALTVFAREYARLDTSIRPLEAEQAVTLEPVLEVYGTVQDANTGRPIQNFRLAPGQFSARRQSSWRPQGYWLAFGNGEFRHFFTALNPDGWANQDFGVKIEADGYAPFLSQPIPPAGKRVRVAARLSPVEEIWITVLNPDGSPARGVAVAPVPEGARAEILTGGFARSFAGIDFLKTDQAGRFLLPPDESIAGIVVLTSSAISEASRQMLKARPVMQLASFGRIEGELVGISTRRLGPDALLRLGPGGPGRTFYYLARSQTPPDADGRFTFSDVPPGQHAIVQYVPIHTGPPVSVKIGAAIVKPGETTRVELDGQPLLEAIRKMREGR